MGDDGYTQAYRVYRTVESRTQQGAAFCLSLEAPFVYALYFPVYRPQLSGMTTVSIPGIHESQQEYFQLNRETANVG